MGFFQGPERGVLRKIDHRKLIGLKIGTIGVILGVIGALLIVYVSEGLGKTIFFIGFAAVFVGLIVTFILTLLPGSKENSE